jgi:site-specific recombinase XerD
MDRSCNSVPGGVSLRQLITDVMGDLQQLRYSRRSLHRYQTVWKKLVGFAGRENFGSDFSENLATQFIAAYSPTNGERNGTQQEWCRHIDRGVGLLYDYALYGSVARPRVNTKDCRVLPAMKATLRDYEGYCRERLFLREATLQSRTRTLTVFLDFLQQRNVRELAQVRAVDLSAFLSSRSQLMPETVARILSDMRSFLRFLALRGILAKDLGPGLPKVRVHPDAHIPSVWDPGLLDKLLGAVDRSSAKGRRDYAILVLACRLGLRVGDIRTLRLDDINWGEARIEITQSKSSTPLSLPLTEDVGQALIAYLRSGRPEVPHREVFLKLQSPFEPFGSNNNLHQIVTYWRRLAGITFQCRQRRGLHSLRHTLATRLLQGGTPLATISAILGHATPDTTRIYAKADVEGLRSVALDPEEVRDDE